MKKTLFLLIFSLFCFTSCGKANINEIKEENLVKQEEIKEEKQVKFFEIEGFWVAKDEKASLSIIQSDKYTLLTIDSLDVIKRSKVKLTDTEVSFMVEGIDYFEYKIENDTLYFTYEDSSFEMVRSSEEDFEKVNEKISELRDSETVVIDNNKEDGLIKTFTKDDIVGYWVETDKDIALSIAGNDLVDITTLGNNLAEEFTLEENVITINEIGTYSIALDEDKKTMLFLVDDEIALKFERCSDLQQYFEIRKKLFESEKPEEDEIDEESTDLEETTINSDVEFEKIVISDKPN